MQRVDQGQELSTSLSFGRPMRLSRVLPGICAEELVDEHHREISPFRCNYCRSLGGLCILAGATGRCSIPTREGPVPERKARRVPLSCGWPVAARSLNTKSWKNAILRLHSRLWALVISTKVIRTMPLPISTKQSGSIRNICKLTATVAGCIRQWATTIAPSPITIR